MTSTPVPASAAFVTLPLNAGPAGDVPIVEPGVPPVAVKMGREKGYFAALAVKSSVRGTVPCATMDERFGIAWIALRHSRCAIWD